MSDRSFILHPAGESFGPFKLDFVRTKLAEGAVAPTTGVTVLVGGVETRYTSVGDLLREEIDENAEQRGTASTQTWHPSKPEVVGNTGPRGDYTDVWRFPCCGAQVISDAAPPSSPGCQTSPASVVEDVIDKIRTFHPEILKTAPAATGQDKIEPIPAPEEQKPSESELPFEWKDHWFLERYLGGLAAEVRCPDCGWTAIWYVRDETPFEHCPQCQYAGSDIPLTTFKGTLKFHNPDLLTAEWIAVIEFCCPGFLSVRASDEALAIRGRRMSKSVTRLAHVPLEESRARRWLAITALRCSREDGCHAALILVSARAPTETIAAGSPWSFPLIAARGSVGASASTTCSTPAMQRNCPCRSRTASSLSSISKGSVIAVVRAKEHPDCMPE